ncbi:MAG: hypothetical protein HOK52_13035 [Candidatus Marinimicrobia bacterium]|jgi:hypothetical protein|nr:hypothetical protein [Candidatus Neomarinimicrobiota bacterium]MBT6937192.1 hypothetical protein [Candidatus Neomarinimicrobiota bacterium]MBT6939046.1 hypothetical protein [Candidatus Neomarinimicrobiota bacterium]MBT7269538.1 hypothetical protein [Candidatus Neomarinimicrobiota bacterium]MBT7900503.1 hypothetical protein [Candidatus Neomarinimicrobiota bacterium]
MSGNDFTKQVTTNDKGEALFHLFKVNNRTPVQYMDIGLDFSNLGIDLKPSDPATVRIKVHAKAPTFYIDIQEKNLNKQVLNPFIMPAVKAFFVSTYGAEFTQSKQSSDYMIKATIHTTARSKTVNEYGLFQTYADGTMSIINTKTGKELYQKSINNVMGVDFTSLDGAGRNALFVRK